MGSAGVERMGERGEDELTFGIKNGYRGIQVIVKPMICQSPSNVRVKTVKLTYSRA